MDWTSIRALRNRLRLLLAEVESGSHLDNGEPDRFVRDDWQALVLACTNKLADLLAIERLRDSHTVDFDLSAEDPARRQESPLFGQASLVESAASILLDDFDAIDFPFHVGDFEVVEDDISHGILPGKPPAVGSTLTIVGKNGGYLVQVARIDNDCDRYEHKSATRVFVTQDVKEDDAKPTTTIILSSRPRTIQWSSH